MHQHRVAWIKRDFLKISLKMENVLLFLLGDAALFSKIWSVHLFEKENKLKPWTSCRKQKKKKNGFPISENCCKQARLLENYLLR